MQLANSILLKRLGAVKIIFPVLLLSLSFATSAQDNSPYSRYGLGDLMPSTNINTRGMGGISAGYQDFISINFNNPASYSQFQTYVEQRSKRLSSGRAIYDVGLNFDTRTLIAPNTPNRFTSSDALFSYVQVGVPLKKNWGLSFGLRPVSRISYLINREEQLYDPITNDSIERAVTQFKGSGGSYLPTIGTGFGFKVNKKNLVSFGLNFGYMFGNRENTTLRSILNDTLIYYSSDYTASTSFGDLFFNAGMQWQSQLSDYTVLRFGATGNWQQQLKASQDVLRQTYTLGSAGEELQIDSVFQQTGIKGKISYPAMYKFGFVVQQHRNDKGWLFGADFTKGKWSNYRFFGQRDSVQDNWMVNVGGQFYPRARDNYFSQITYRFGFFAGSDYVKVANNLPVLGATFGLALPITKRTRLTANQFNYLNIALEYVKRGNNDNLLKENLFRISVGLNLSDLWFGKKKYD